MNLNKKTNEELINLYNDMMQSMSILALNNADLQAENRELRMNVDKLKSIIADIHNADKVFVSDKYMKYINDM